jgi:hypothetical protein
MESAFTRAHLAVLVRVALLPLQTRPVAHRAVWRTTITISEVQVTVLVKNDITCNGEYPLQQRRINYVPQSK